MRPLFPDHAGISPTTQTNVNSLQEKSPFAGETIGTHIEKYRPLVISLRLRGATQQNATHSRSNRQVRRSYARRPAARVPSSKRHIPSISRLRMSVRRVRRSYASRLAARSSVFEVAHSVYKYAPNMCSFGCGG